MSEVTGTTASGVVGVLLAVTGPVIRVTSPELWTSKGNTKVIGAGAVS